MYSTTIAFIYCNSAYISLYKYAYGNPTAKSQRRNALDRQSGVLKTLQSWKAHQHALPQVTES